MCQVPCLCLILQTLMEHETEREEDNREWADEQFKRAKEQFEEDEKEEMK